MWGQLLHPAPALASLLPFALAQLMLLPSSPNPGNALFSSPVVGPWGWRGVKRGVGGTVPMFLTLLRGHCPGKSLMGGLAALPPALGGAHGAEWGVRGWEWSLRAHTGSV